MTWWMILLIILVALWLILQFRFGAKARYAPDGMTVRLLLGPFHLQVVPSKKDKKPKTAKEAKPKKERKSAPEESLEGEEDKPGTLSRLMKLLPVIAEAAGALKRKIRIDDLYLSVIWGSGEDAASAAIGFGRANAAIGMIWPLLDHNFKVKNSTFHTDVNYGASAPVVVAEATVTLTIGQLLSLVIRYGLKVLINWTRSGKPSKQ